MTGYKFELYKDNAGEHRWRFMAPNGNIMAVSSEGYSNKIDCAKAMETLREAALKSAVVDLVVN